MRFSRRLGNVFRRDGQRNFEVHAENIGQSIQDKDRGIRDAAFQLGYVRPINVGGKRERFL